MQFRYFVAAVPLVCSIGFAQTSDPYTIDGLKQLSTASNVSNVKTFLSALPAQLKKNYVLLENSLTGRPADALNPRVVMYSSDARLLMAVAAHPGDQLREVVDLAELDPRSGFWKFRSLDFRQKPAVLSNDDSTCQRCHGSPARPIWPRSYGNWPGAFGPDFDRLTATQASAANWFLANQAQTERLHHLSLYKPGQPYAAGSYFWINRAYGYPNTVFGFELSSAAAEGIYLRLRNNPRYQALRNGFLLFRNDCGRNAGQSQAWTQFETNLRAAGATSVSERELYRVLGIDLDRDFPIGDLASDSRKDVFWSNGEDFLFGLVSMLVLDEVLPGNDALRRLLAATPDDATFGVKEPNLEQALAYRIRVGWRLRGEERQVQREGSLRLGTFRGQQGVFSPLGTRLCTTLLGSGQTTPPDPPPPGGASRTFTGTLARQGAYAYVPSFEAAIQSGAGTIDGVLTSPANTSFRLYLISVDRYQVVASSSDTGNVKRVRYQAPAGRYVWYVQAETGSGDYRIQSTTP